MYCIKELSLEQIRSIAKIKSNSTLNDTLNVVQRPHWSQESQGDWSNLASEEELYEDPLVTAALRNGTGQYPPTDYVPVIPDKNKESINIVEDYQGISSENV
jgi:hypothetical protein